MLGWSSVGFIDEGQLIVSDTSAEKKEQKFPFTDWQIDKNEWMSKY